MYIDLKTPFSGRSKIDFPNLKLAVDCRTLPEAAKLSHRRIFNLSRLTDARISYFGISSSPRPFQPTPINPDSRTLENHISNLKARRRLRDHCGCFLKQANNRRRRASIDVSTPFPGPLKIDFSPLSSNLRRDARIGPEARAILDSSSRLCEQLISSTPCRPHATRLAVAHTSEHIASAPHATQRELDVN
ncbi:hypothetical protein D9611_014214 [Ephemerocybe angulata]|uniref:Uncharacterized protein n=1 Tax=Ephemerocybe angulata TaxID=980116 RepID=A0A8H5CC83_9AGAR|nr:hypothetical protein D9611_014214 [Tulosesus angulatus]